MRAARGLCVDSATRVLAVKQSEPTWQKTKATNVRDDGFCCAYSQVERLHGRHLRQRLGLREPVRFQDCPGATRLQEVLALLKSDSICFASRRVNCGLWRWFCQKCKTDICDKCHRRKATWTSNSHADRQSQRTVFLLSRSDSRYPKRPCPRNNNCSRRSTTGAARPGERHAREPEEFRIWQWPQNTSSQSISARRQHFIPM